MPQALLPEVAAAAALLERGRKNGRRAELSRTHSTVTPAGIALLQPDATTAPDAQPGKNGSPFAKHEHEIPLALIAPSRINPRKDFAQEELRALADTLAAHGLLQAVVLRPIPQDQLPASPLVGKLQPKLEIVAGERRCRAAALLNWKTIRAVVRDLDDRAAREVALLENEQRTDLNDLERAAGYRELLALSGETQAALAQRLGKSQPYVANLLRLLELPPAWSKRLISGEITQTQARSLLPYVSRPQLLAELEHDLAQAAKAKDAELPLPREEFDELLCGSVKHATRSVDRGRSNYVQGRYVETLFKPTAAQLQQLDCLKVPDAWNPKRTETRACNLDLWDQLNAAAATKQKQRDAVDDDEDDDRPTKKKKAPSAADRKRRAEQLAHAYLRRMTELRIDWLARLCAQRLQKQSPPVQPPLIWALLLALACDEPAASLVPKEYGESNWNFDKRVAQRRALLWGKETKPRADHFAAALAKLPEQSSAYYLRVMDFVRLCLWTDADEPARLLGPGQVERLARELHVDLRAAWRAERLGPLQQRFWDAHDRQQLCEMGKAAGIYCTPDEPKKTLVSRLATSPAHIPLPALLDFPAAPRTKKKSPQQKPKPR